MSPARSESESDEDVPLSQRSAPTSRRAAATKKPIVDESSDEDEVPLNKIAQKKTKTVAKKSATNGGVKRSGENGTKKRIKTEPASPSKPTKRVKTEAANGTTKKVKSEPVSPKKEPKKEPKEPSEGPEDDEEDESMWWNADWEDGEEKWQTLEHNGVMFPPPYEPLPKGVHLLYNGRPVELHPEAEEVAGFFGAMLNSPHTENPVFQQNFFNDFLQVVKETGGAKIDGKDAKLESFEKCDFTKIFDFYERQRQEKKSLTSAQKKAIKAEKDALDEKYKTCIIDGRKEPVGNFRIEPPGLFRGRGQHPKTGKLKARVKPEQVTINIGKDAKVPEPPEGHQWAEVKHDNTVAWLATWKENINGNNKYVMLAQSSSFKGKSDFKKFEKARELKNHVERIRKDYYKELDDKVMEKRQRATAMYLIDVFALRAGGEKGEDEADTVGCCSLRYEHVTLSPPNIVEFDFLGKDSIRYYQRAEVDKRVFRNLRIFKKAPKGPGDDIFDRLDPSTLNKHLQNYMPGLTAKVFRTYNASYTMQKLLDQVPNEGTVNEKVVAFNAANREVAILCNHQRGVTQGHAASVSRIGDKLIELQYNKIKAKQMMLELEPTLKKKEPEYFEEIGVLSKEQIQNVHEKLLEREKIKIERKFQRENEKLEADNEKPMPPSELETRLEALKEMEAELKKELKTGKPEIKGNVTVEKLRAQVDKYEERITNTTLQLKDKEDNSTVALSTSKMNYIDPRLVAMFSRKFGVPIEKLFTKTLRVKFNWAIHMGDEKWRF